MIAATRGQPTTMSLLSVRDLSVAFATRDGIVRAVNDVTFSLDAGKVLALLGESGSGKSVTLRAILGLHPAVRTRVSGEVLLKGRDVNRLDETAQAQILWLLRDLQPRLGLAVVFVTHDLGVASEIADDAAVMYAGRIVEQAPIRELFRRPAHPYTEGLMQATVRRGQKGHALVPIPGAPPNLVALPPGCAFAPRCAVARADCTTTS